MAAFDNPDLGTDIANFGDLAPLWGLTSGRQNLAAAFVRRFQTPLGGLAYDDSYGYDLRDLVNADLTPAELAAARAAITAQALQEPRIQNARVSLDQTTKPGTLLVPFALEDDDGPFDLVLAASKVTVDILGGAFGTPAVVPENVAPPIIVPGPSGPPGPQGPGGPSGSGITIGSDDLFVATGAEVVLRQRLVDLSTLSSTMTAELAALAAVASGTGTFRLRIGGSQDVADGTVAVTVSTSSASFVQLSSTVTVSNPGGVQLVKVTGQSATVGQDASIRGFTVSFR